MILPESSQNDRSDSARDREYLSEWPMDLSDTGNHWLCLTEVRWTGRHMVFPSDRSGTIRRKTPLKTNWEDRSFEFVFPSDLLGCSIKGTICPNTKSIGDKFVWRPFISATKRPAANIHSRRIGALILYVIGIVLLFRGKLQLKPLADAARLNTAWLSKFCVAIFAICLKLPQRKCFVLEVALPIITVVATASQCDLLVRARQLFWGYVR